VLSSANTDDVTRIITEGRNTDPHLMRLITIDFHTSDISTPRKHQADAFKRAIHDNYGHAGAKYIKYVTENYESVKRLLLRNCEKLETDLSATAPERFWTASMGCQITGGMIAHGLGLIPFSPRDDIEWTKLHFRRQRDAINSSHVSPENLLVEFMETHQYSALVLSPKAASNLDNVTRSPSGALLIRHEVDNGIIYVARQAMMEWCAKQKLSFRKLEGQLQASGAIVNSNVQKVLGADTTYAKGQTRCWKIDSTALGAQVQPQLAQITAATNVVNIIPPRKYKP